MRIKGITGKGAKTNLEIYAKRMLSQRTGFTEEEIERLDAIYWKANEKGNIYIGAAGGNIFWLLKDTPEREEFLQILRRRFPELETKGLDVVNWKLVTMAMGITERVG